MTTSTSLSLEVAPSREGLSAAIDNLGIALQYAEDRAERLTVRLNSVLPNATQGQPAAVLEDAAFGSSVAVTTLADLARRIYALGHRIDRLGDDVEL